MPEQTHLRREGWDEAFSRMARNGDDHLIDEATATQFDAVCWDW
jgi:hypothetical protein